MSLIQTTISTVLGPLIGQIERVHAERIMDGIALLPPPDDGTDLFDPDDEDNADD